MENKKLIKIDSNILLWKKGIYVRRTELDSDLKSYEHNVYCLEQKGSVTKDNYKKLKRIVMGKEEDVEGIVPLKQSNFDTNIPVYFKEHILNTTEIQELMSSYLYKKELIMYKKTVLRGLGELYSIVFDENYPFCFQISNNTDYNKLKDYTNKNVFKVSSLRDTCKDCTGILQESTSYTVLLLPKLKLNKYTLKYEIEDTKVDPLVINTMYNKLNRGTKNTGLYNKKDDILESTLKNLLKLVELDKDIFELEKDNRLNQVENI